MPILLVQGKALRHETAYPSAEPRARIGFLEHPHAECLMTCGSGDDDRFHFRKFGKGFGLCEKCAAAARAFVEGLNAAL